MLLKKCKNCNKYTLKEICPKPNCKDKTKEAHYKYIKVKNAPKSK